MTPHINAGVCILNANQAHSKHQDGLFPFNLEFLTVNHKGIKNILLKTFQFSKQLTA
jgi:hypothetical protein